MNSQSVLLPTRGKLFMFGGSDQSKKALIGEFVERLPETVFIPFDRLSLPGIDSSPSEGLVESFALWSQCARTVVRPALEDGRNVCVDCSCADFFAENIYGKAHGAYLGDLFSLFNRVREHIMPANCNVLLDRSTDPRIRRGWDSYAAGTREAVEVVSAQDIDGDLRAAVQKIIDRRFQ